MYFKVIKSGTNRKLVYDFLLEVYSNFCPIITFAVSHTVFEKFDMKQSNDLEMPKVIDIRITWKVSCCHVCNMFGRQWTNEAKIAIFNDPTLIWRTLSSEPLWISA